MVSEGNQLIDNFNPLRAGFIWSLVSLCLLLLAETGPYFIPTSYAGYALLFFYFVYPFLILFVWAYGAHKRVEGWTVLEQKNVADMLSFSWKTNLFFILPLPLIFLFSINSWSLLNFLMSPNGPLLWAVVTCVAWGLSTVCEARGLKKLEEEKKIRLRLSRICSLLGIIVYACCIVVGYLASTQFSFIGLPLLGFLPLHFSILSNAMILASPLLIISCINAIIQLKQVNAS